MYTIIDKMSGKVYHVDGKPLIFTVYSEAKHYVTDVMMKNLTEFAVVNRVDL